MRRELWNRKSGLKALHAGLSILAFALVASAPAFAAPAEKCGDQPTGKPPVVTRFQVHPFTKSFKTIPDLQKRLPEIEADLRAVIAQGGLEPGVADALIAAIQSGYGLSDYVMGPPAKTQLQWMAYRCGGQAKMVAMPTLKLRKKYNAFEIVVEVPEPPPAAPTDYVCEISATRDCAHENPTITVDIDGSSKEPQVTMATNKEAPTPMTPSGTRWTMPDPSPYCNEYTFEVKAHGSPRPPRFARVYRFLMPKDCGNLGYVGELAKKQIEPEGPPAWCDKASTVEMCKPWCEPKVEPSEVEVHQEVQVSMTGGWCDDKAKLSVTGPEHSVPLMIEQPPFSSAYMPAVPNKDCFPPYDVTCQAWNAAGDEAKETTTLEVVPHDWIARGFLFYSSPTGDDQNRNFLLNGQVAAHEKYSIDSGYGAGFSIERKLNKVVGLEAAALLGRNETTYELSTAATRGEDSHNANLVAFTFGPNFHVTACAAVDLYLGPFIGYGGLADPNYWVNGHHFHADLKTKFVWGAQIGLDIPFNPAKDIGFHGGLRYIVFDEESDMGTFDVDPLIFEAGLSFRF